MKTLLTIFILLMSYSRLMAGDFEQSLFLNGEQISASEVENSSIPNLQSRYSRLNRLCPDDANFICVDWQLSLNSPLQEQQARTMVEEALQVWLQGANLPIRFIYSGLRELTELPTEANMPFIFSFKDFPALEFLENELSKTIKYLDYSNQSWSGIQWAGIFINPLKNPLASCNASCLSLTSFASFSIRSVLVFEIGRMLGLGPSGLSQSVMFPIQIRGSTKRYDFLRDDDKAWIEAVYDIRPSTSGAISGRIIDGTNSSSWPGGQILLLPVSSIQDFSESLDVNLFTQSALSKKDGRFIFPNVPEGSYVLLAESMNGTSLVPDIFDDWLKIFGRSDSFEPDFYDGKSRESNLELVRYSPRAIWFAASVHVLRNTTTENVEIISNVFDPNVERIEAPGSTNEALSPFSPEDVEDFLSEQAGKDDAEPDGSSGCSIHDKKELSLSFILICFFTLVWIARYRFRYSRVESDHLKE